MSKSWKSNDVKPIHLRILVGETEAKLDQNKSSVAPLKKKTQKIPSKTKRIQKSIIEPKTNENKNLLQKPKKSGLKLKEIRPYVNSAMSVAQVHEAERRTIYVDNINFQTEKKDLMSFFKKFGSIQKMWVKSSKRQPKPILIGTFFLIYNNITFIVSIVKK